MSPRSRTRSVPFLTLGVATIALAGGGEGALTASAAPGKGVVQIVRLKGPAADGELQSIGPEGIRLVGQPSPIPVDDVREARFSPDGPPLPLDKGVGLRVVLVAGETVRGVLVSGSKEGIDVKPPDMPALHLSFEAIRRIETESAYSGPCDEPARRHPPRPGSDLLWSRTEDTYPGTVVSAGTDGVTIQTDKDRRTTIAWNDLSLVHLDNPEKAAPEGLVAEIETAGGSTFAAKELSATATDVTATIPTGLTVSVPTASVRAIRWSGGSFVYACDLPFTSIYRPHYGPNDPNASILAAWYQARAHRMPEGCPLSIAGARYRHGIGVHATSTVTIPLGKAYSRFEAKFGLDDFAQGGPEGMRGDVTARVLADGREVWTSGGSVKGGQPARAVGPIDVTGVSTLVLEVGEGQGLHKHDYADWVDPILVRAK